MVILPSAFMAEIHDLNRFSNETWCNIPKKSHGALGLSINQSCLVQPTPKMMKLVLYRTESRRFIMPDNWDIHGCTPSLSPSSICSLCDWMMCVYIYIASYIQHYIPLYLGFFGQIWNLQDRSPLLSTLIGNYGNENPVSVDHNHHFPGQEIEGV